MKTFKRLSTKNKVAIVNEVKLMIAAHRDTLWSQWEECSHSKAVDPATWQSVCNEGFYGEAFGIIRGLVALGYGYFGSDNMDATEEMRSDAPEHNLKWWFQKIMREYLEEEGFFNKTCSASKCRELLETYRQLVRK